MLHMKLENPTLYLGVIVSLTKHMCDTAEMG